MDKKKKLQKRDVDGFDIVTDAVLNLVNQYPGLMPGDEIVFATLDEVSGKAIFPAPDSAIEDEKEDVTGHVTQTCLYSFHAIYKAGGLSERRKINVKEWVDNLGKWLSRETVIINGNPYRLEEYPPLTGGRKLISFDRQLQTQGNLDTIEENGSENWAIKIIAIYKNEFDR